MEWQPIETLPKDYEPFDVWTARGYRIADCMIGVTTYKDPVTYKKSQGIVYEADYDCNGQVMELVENATHWMRVDPPKQ